MKTTTPEILCVSLSNDDSALFVNSVLIYSLEASENGEPPNCLAEKMEEALGIEAKYYNMDTPLDPEWNWDDVLELIPQGDSKKQDFISACMYTDDRVYEVDFNAAPWFEQASDDEILALCEIGLAGDTEADHVAYFLEDAGPGNDKIKEAFSYLQKIKGTPRACGFECEIDAENALTWIEKNRPELHARLTANAVMQPSMSN